MVDLGIKFDSEIPGSQSKIGNSVNYGTLINYEKKNKFLRLNSFTSF